MPILGRKSLILAIFSFFISTASFATSVVLVNPRPPAVQNAVGTTGVTVYYAAILNGVTALGGAGVAIDTNRGFSVIDTGAVTATANLITLDISTDSAPTVAAGQHLVLTVSRSSGSEPVPLLGAVNILPGDSTSIPNGTCSGCQSSNHTATFTAGSILRVSFSISDFCAATGTASTLCTSYATMASGTQYSATAYVTIGAIDDTDTGDGPMGVINGSISNSFALAITNIPPTVSSAANTTCLATPTVSLSDPNFYFPGDSEIIIDSGNFIPSTQAGAPLANLLLFAKQDGSAIVPIIPPVNGAVPTAFSTNDLYAYIETTGSPRVNTDNGATANFVNEITYRGIMYAENAAGIISQGCVGSDPTWGIVAQPISGVLKKSKCFIATAAYQNGDAYPVKMLRQFREQILLDNFFGKLFVKYYYRYSPPLAEWAWNKHWARSIALKYLTPLELVVFFILNPILFFTLLIGTLFLVFGFFRLKNIIFFLFLTVFLNPLSTFAQESVSNSPYLDRLKKQIQADDAKNNIEQTQGSYSDQQKKKLLESKDKRDIVPQESSPSYTEEIRRNLKEEPKAEGSGSYVERERAKIPAEKDAGSLISQVKAGIDKPKDRELPPIRNAMGLKIGVTPGVEVIADSGTNTFTEVYGSSWIPDFMLHYERQLFHSEYLGSFAPTFDFGGCYVGGPGLLKNAFNGSRKSRTNFSLIQVPALVGANYRLNFFRILRPYVAANVGAIAVTEIRNDKQKDKRDISFVYSATVGVSFLMDFLEPGSRAEAYDSSGFQHVFLFAEYTVLRTLAGEVAFGRNGIYSGFLFEI